MDQLKDALRVAEAFWQEYDGKDKSQQCWQLFTVLVEQTVSDLAFSEQIPELQQYDADHLANCLAGKRVSANKPSSKRIKQLYDQLSILLTEKQCRLKEFARQLNCKVIPCLRRQQGGGANNRSQYWIEAVELGDAPTDDAALGHSEKNTADTETPADIKYYLDALPKLPRWSRFLAHINLGDSGWKRWLMVLIVCSPFVCISVFVILTLLIINATIININSTLYTLLLMYPFLYFFGFGFLIKAMNNNIALLPQWMLPFRLDSAVFQFTINNASEKDYRIKELGIKVYAAKCPVCNHRVDLKSGGLKHWGRIIGVCDHNPIEHRYSFDFTNLKGNKLL